MKRARRILHAPSVWALSALLATFGASTRARADDAARAPSRDGPEPPPAASSGVTFGVTGGVAGFVADADSQIGSAVSPSAGVRAGYRFGIGVAPELSFFYTSAVTGLAPGVRWSLPIGVRVHPWIDAHAGVAHATLTSGDTASGYTYGTLEAGSGVELWVTRVLSVELGGEFTYANVLDPPRAQPLPPGAVAPRTPSYALDWLTVRAGLAFVL